jgi:hypothetical protein
MKRMVLAKKNSSSSAASRADPPRFRPLRVAPGLRRGKLPELPEQSYEPPRVLVAVAEEVAPKLGLGVRGQRARLEQQPLELEAGRPAVSPIVEIVVPELWHHRGQHALEAEAAAEVRVIDMVAHGREEIHEAVHDVPKGRGQRGQRLGHPLEAPALERSAVGDHRAGIRAGADHALCQRWPRIAGPLRQPLVVGHAAAGLLHVAAELDGHGIVGMTAGPDRNGQADGLEVEERDGRREVPQRRTQPGLLAIANFALETLEQVYGWRRDAPLQIKTHLR